MSVGQFRIKFSRIPQRIPLSWADDPASKRLLKRNEWLTGLKGRLPRHYVEFYKQWAKGPQAYIHDEKPKSRFKKDEFGNVHRVHVPRIPILYPDEFHQGLWGGEGVVKGGLEPEYKKHMAHYRPAKESYWFPNLHLGVVYSEILNIHMEVVMTERAERLIDEAYGLDNYLLKTQVNEIYSHFGLKLKRELLLTLANAEEDLYPDEKGKQKTILDKYKDYILPLEEADWHGLPLHEALHKQHTLDRIEEEESIKPLKEEYRRKLVARLADGEDVKGELELEEPEDESLLSSIGKSVKSVFKK